MMIRKWAVLVLLCLAPLGESMAALVWSAPAKITQVQVVEFGGFLLFFDRQVNPVCTAASAGSAVYFYPNQRGVTAEGVKAMLATSLLAFASNLDVKVLYDDEATTCWSAYIVISR